MQKENADGQKDKRQRNWDRDREWQALGALRPGGQAQDKTGGKPGRPCGAGPPRRDSCFCSNGLWPQGSTRPRTGRSDSSEEGRKADLWLFINSRNSIFYPLPVQISAVRGQVVVRLDGVGTARNGHPVDCREPSFKKKKSYLLSCAWFLLWHSDLLRSYSCSIWDLVP